jgi:hypothetical protein
MRIYVVFLKSIKTIQLESLWTKTKGLVTWSKADKYLGVFFLILIREEREKGKDKYLGLVNMNIGSIQKVTRLKSSGLDWDPPHVG